MTEEHTPNRRTVLKSITVGSTIGAGLSTGSSAEQPSDDTGRSGEGIPFDLEVTNRTEETAVLLVKLFSVSKSSEGFSRTGPPVYQESFSLAGEQRSTTGESNRVTRTLDITGDQLYEAEISTAPRASETASTVFGVPEGGIPEYMALVLDRSRSGELRAVVAKE